MKTLGEHFLIDLYGCSSDLLNDKELIESILNQAAKVANATVVTSNIHQFSPFGVSGVLVISESHIAIHTWPEHKFAAIEFFRCSSKFKIELAKKYILSKFNPGKSDEKKVNRGKLNL